MLVGSNPTSLNLAGSLTSLFSRGWPRNSAASVIQLAKYRYEQASFPRALRHAPPGFLGTDENRTICLPRHVTESIGKRHNSRADGGAPVPHEKSRR